MILIIIRIIMIIIIVIIIRMIIISKLSNKQLYQKHWHGKHVSNLCWYIWWFYKYNISSNQYNYICLSFLFISNYDLILIFFLQTSILSLNCLFLPLQYTKMNNMKSTRKWHIFIYKESTYTCRCICSCNYIVIQKFATCITNTHSSLKYCPMTTDDIFS